MKQSVKNEEASNTRDDEKVEAENYANSFIRFKLWSPYFIIWGVQIFLTNCYAYNYKSMKYFIRFLPNHFIYIFAIQIALKAESAELAVGYKNTIVVLAKNLLFVSMSINGITKILSLPEFYYFIPSIIIFTLINAIAILKMDSYIEKCKRSFTKTASIFAIFLAINIFVMVCWLEMGSEVLLEIIVLVECCLDIVWLPKINQWYKVSKIILELPTIFLLVYKYALTEPSLEAS